MSTFETAASSIVTMIAECSNIGIDAGATAAWTHPFVVALVNYYDGTELSPEYAALVDAHGLTEIYQRHAQKMKEGD